MTPKEGLHKITRFVVVSNVDEKIQELLTEDSKYPIMQTEEYKVIEQALTELDRLQKKETAMKVDIGTYGILSDTHRCPNCNVRIKEMNYCKHCGQRIDFGDDEK